MSVVIPFPLRNMREEPEQIESFFSDKTPPEVIEALNAANDLATPEETGAQLRQIVADYPMALDGHIALYKFYFRTGQYGLAERAVWACLREAARQGGFSWKYRRLTPDTADWLDDHAVARLYLFSLKALGVIRLRREKVRAAHRVLSVLLTLDPHNEVGGGAFLEIAESILEEEEDDAEPA